MEKKHSKNNNRILIGLILFFALLFTIGFLYALLSPMSTPPAMSDSGYEERKNRVQKRIVNLLEITPGTSTELHQLLSFHQLNAKGDLQSINESEALQILFQERSKPKPNLNLIFYHNKDSLAIIPTVGKGMWDNIYGYILVNLTANKVAKVEFDHLGETPSIGSKIKEDKWEKQFFDKTIEHSSNTFSLLQDSKKIIEGQHQIDGISGATTTGEGAVKMVNEGLLKFGSVLQEK